MKEERITSKLKSRTPVHVEVPFMGTGKPGEDKVLRLVIKTCISWVDLKCQSDIQLDLVSKQLNI